MFKRTALKLTLQYAAILFVTIFIFSTSIYIYMSITFGADFVGTYQIGHTDQLQSQRDVQEVADAGLSRLRNGLIIFDGALLVIIPFLAYAMASRSLKPLKESYELQESFTDNASHELRTPLTVISGELELALQKTRDSEEYVTAIQRSLDETRDLIHLTNQLLLLSQGNTVAIRNTFAEYGLSSIIIGSIKKLNLSPEDTERIVVKVDTTTSVYGNHELLQRAIGNVISNAVKFTPPTGKITISSHQMHETVAVIVQDEGKGMDKQEVMQAFNRFWRAESARTASGHGLGLSITKRILKLHEGKVSIDSVPSQGTSVKLTFPIYKI